MAEKDFKFMQQILDHQRLNTASGVVTSGSTIVTIIWNRSQLRVQADSDQYGWRQLQIAISIKGKSNCQFTCTDPRCGKLSEDYLAAARETKRELFDAKNNATLREFARETGVEISI